MLSVGAGRRCQVAAESNVAAVIHHVVEHLAKLAATRCSVACVHNRADISRCGLLDIQAAQRAHEVGRRREARNDRFFASDVADNGTKRRRRC